MRPALVAIALVLVLVPSAGAAPGQAGGTDPVGDNGYNAPDVHTVAAVWDGEMLAFGVEVTQTGLFSGDRIAVQIDANRDGIADHQMMLECCPVGRWLGAWNGVGWNIDIPQSTFVSTYDAGRLQAYVNRAEVGLPAGELGFRVQTMFVAANSWDLAPNAGWYVLPQETAVGGASGGPPQSSPPSSPAPPTQSTPAAPAIDARRGRSAIRGLVRRKLGRRARITRLTCDAEVRCRLAVRRGAWRYNGTATVRVLASGAYKATFSGTRSKRGCGRRCRTRVRW